MKSRFSVGLKYGSWLLFVFGDGRVKVENAILSESWLGNKDSNLDRRSQSP